MYAAVIDDSERNDIKKSLLAVLTAEGTEDTEEGSLIFLCDLCALCGLALLQLHVFLSLWFRLADYFP